MSFLYPPYIGAVPAFKPGTLVATGYAITVVADGHVATAQELAAALETVEALSEAALSKSER
jgi:hypothetical protein